MKHSVLILLFGLGLALGCYAQNFYDDIYYDKSKKEKYTLPDANIITVQPSSTRSVDEYNRFTFSTNPENLMSDTTDTDFKYTSKIAKYYNPKVVTINDPQYVYIVSDNVKINNTTTYSGWNTCWNCNWGWGGWYSPWYNPWYDPWYRPYDPWYRPYPHPIYPVYPVYVNTGGSRGNTRYNYEHRNSNGNTRSSYYGGNTGGYSGTSRSTGYSSPYSNGNTRSNSSYYNSSTRSTGTYNSGSHNSGSYNSSSHSSGGSRSSGGSYGGGGGYSGGGGGRSMTIRR